MVKPIFYINLHLAKQRPRHPLKNRLHGFSQRRAAGPVTGWRFFIFPDLIGAFCYIP
jgi:hypothetical protein